MARSETDLAADYAGVVAPDSPGLLGYWRFDKGPVAMAFDSSICPLDSDGDVDGYGNLCDGDLNNDGSTNTLDLNLYKQAHRTGVGDANYDVDADFNGDGTINTLDLNIYKGLHRLLPGPSCCAP